MASKPQHTPITAIRTAPSHSSRAHPYWPSAPANSGTLPNSHDNTPPSVADDVPGQPVHTARSRAQARPKAKSPAAKSSGGGRSAQPKSTRKQFSACGGCQVRQVKCDLKDKIASNGEGASCTACSEREVNCVPVYPANAKPKAQRRGRRLQVIEKYYGKNAGEGGNVDVKDVHSALITAAGNSKNVAGPSSSSLSSSHSSSLAAPRKSCIPPLHPDFFQSPFYRSFHTQRPIVDPTEFRERFMASLQGRPEALGPIGALISMILVTWAASYGVDESGREDPALADASGLENLAAVRERRARCNMMVKEMLEIIDHHALLRKPSWDGVRVLMLIMPLTEESLNPVDRMSMYQSTISQIYNLCTHGTSLQHSGASDPDKMVVARVFWYAYVHEGITSGLRGRKLIFDDDDLRVFESTLPRVRAGGAGGLAMTPRPINDQVAFRFSTAPIRLSTACRQINYALTGPRAMARSSIDEKKLTEGWETLSACWLEFEELRSQVDTGVATFMQKPDMERFISGWQIFLFECHNVIRETLKEKAIEEAKAARAPQVFAVGESLPERQPTNVNRLLQLAESHCRELHTRVMQVIRQQLNSERFFQYDASLVRDGTFYAGNWACFEAESQEDVEVCIMALEKMRWAFSSGEVRIATLRFAWRNRHSADNTSNDYSPVVSSSVYHTPPGSFQLAPLETLDHVNGTASTSPYGRDDSPWDPLHQTVSSMPNGVATSRYRRSSSARSFGGVGDAGGSPHTPSVGGSSYSGPSSFPLTPDPSHPPAAFFGLPQPAPQQSQSSSSWFNRGAVAQRQESEPSWLPSNTSPFPSPTSQSHHHSQPYGTLSPTSHTCMTRIHSSSPNNNIIMFLPFLPDMRSLTPQYPVINPIRPPRLPGTSTRTIDATTLI
ncbi:hypothetical protein BS47DRAFT_846376 [Hydnum rufescens UP504]|uniref:Zn(2)-C6 fungal-type domain-containing protein n=1 Tax=Hydnum rufescens UP504 TaxID=1448309 RepID=A0A9P6E031_9AGAM|nr:hypothetical protein BS47DRAFT_846376 [Hydnum rufescens UP504]